ncbi:glycosyltransferase family 2 protein [Draconibacterium halophilum]|uniref:Glycosyltransferase family 2 protein n=1 Tax=Draconibacterium halophilum TaxID=2706887 RepID=A0A6C0REI4_9BACT|nr:glycosyltransferase family 2 protein [Draconibacterium halophilum]QIA08549.1 glycosyltransferase family 2 protein [Draconibacterium halophilum]
MSISVCIPTYNGEAYIKEQLDSILNQTRTVDEIIISDDSSTDHTVEIIQSYNNPRIKLFEKQKFSNPIFNLEFALKQAKGDYIFLADQDDVWMHNKVEVLVKELANSKLVISDGVLINQEGELIAPSIFEIFNSRRGFFKNLTKSSYMGCCMAFHKELLPIVLPFPQSIAMHDLWIGLNAELYTSPVFCPGKLVKYRRHGLNKTPLDAKTNRNSLFYKIAFRLTMLILLASRFTSKKMELLFANR